MSYLTTTQVTFDFPSTTFQITVPGDQFWYPRSVIAVAETDVGGAPNRAYQLTFATSTGPVAVNGANDAGTEPATVTVTWCNCPAATVAAGNVGTSVAPIPTLELRPGYTITGEILSPFGVDTWSSAFVWYDFVYSNS